MLIAFFLQLVFASRILFVIILGSTKLSTMFLIREIFTKVATRWWFRVLVVVALAQAVVGSLIVSVECSPAGILEGKDNRTCPGNVRPRLSFSSTKQSL